MSDVALGEYCRDLMGVRMSGDEAWEALAKYHTGIFTSLRADGMPISVPVWFTVADRRIYFVAPVGTKKIARVRNDQRCCFLVESGERWAELQAVLITGRAHVVDDRPELEERIGADINTKYQSYRSDRTAMPEATRAVYTPPGSLIEIIPDERVLNWDNARLGLA